MIEQSERKTGRSIVRSPTGKFTLTGQMLLDRLSHTYLELGDGIGEGKA